MGQGVSTAQWFVYGRRNFTQSGYLRHIQEYKSPLQNKAHIHNDQPGSDNNTRMNGKNVIVTGANSGIGKELATYAAAKGANVYMLCRSKHRAEQARNDILKSTNAPEDNIHILLADVGEFSQVRSAVEELQGKEAKVDCLVCNAGVLLTDKQLTSDGTTEATIASHLLGGSYLLTKLLLPQLEASKDAGGDPRVVYVTSAGMYLSKMPSWDIFTHTAKDQTYDGVKAYTYAKRGQVILAEALAKDKKNEKVTFVTAHPGWVDTAAVDDAFGSDKKYLEPLRNTWAGAEGIAWLMGTDTTTSGSKGTTTETASSTCETIIENGGFYLDRKAQKKHLSGPFMTEGTFTKNSDAEINDFMENLKRTCGI